MRYVVSKAMRVFVVILTLGCLLLSAVPAQANSALPPGQKGEKYVRWYYPSQLTYGSFEFGNGDRGMAPSPKAFLTLPFMGPHIVTSLFDHCYPDYSTNGKVCRYDGTEASVNLGGADPTFDAGYAQTPAGHDYLYYDGHDGYDYALTYEPVAAAAPGTVMLANWLDPNCHSCLSGLTVEINHGNGLLSFYGHLSQINVAKGQYVVRGQVIGVSGMSGTATGPHLHFGIYNIHRAQTPVDPYGWSGSYPDPYAWDQGDLWLTGSPRFADITMPKVSVNAAANPDDLTAIDVSWSSPGTMNFTVYVVTQDGRRATWTSSRGNGSATFHGKHGQAYWFWVGARSDLGWTDGAGSDVVGVPRLSRGALTN